MKVTILHNSESFYTNFQRCCVKYGSLHIVSAWCGDPNQILPFAMLENYEGAMKATIGISFNHTHPDAINFLLKMKTDIKIYDDIRELFHPKIYVFKNNKEYAVFIGSSNFTYGGFHENIEVNILYEGVPNTNEINEINKLEQQIQKWHQSNNSFKPDKKWNEEYRIKFNKTIKNDNKYKSNTERNREYSRSNASWLGVSDWKTYYNEIESSYVSRDIDGSEYHEVLDEVAKNLIIPWEINDFDKIENRRLILGMEPYGWLGHVGASGRSRQLFTNGTKEEKNTIVKAINKLHSLNPPIIKNEFVAILNTLILLGPSMRVWSRLLSIVRPDLYCTISSDSVRKNLSKILEIPFKAFDNPDGYWILINLIHNSPWFNSKKPKDKDELKVWERRVAFLDVIFHQ